LVTKIGDLWLISNPLVKSNTLVSANRYDLHGQNVTVVYGEAGADGKPYLNFTNTELSLAFKGNQIRVIQNTDVGKLVSVSLRMTIDAGSTSFTLLLPKTIVAKGQGVSVSVKTFGITTIHRAAVIPILRAGQDDLYTTVALSGSASFESPP
jgi:hypothetical protein